MVLLHLKTRNKQMNCGHNENKDDPNVGEEYEIMNGKKLRLISK